MQTITLNFNDFKAFEIVFQDPSRKWKRVLCQVERVEGERISVSVNNEKNNNVVMPVNTTAFVNVYTSNGIYTSDSKVLSVTPGTILTHYEIGYPVNTRHAQRREYFRADMSIYFLANITKENSFKVDVINGKTRNLCGRGMSFYYPLNIGSYNSIDVQFTLADRTIKTTAELIYSRKVYVMGSSKYVHAFHFLNINRQDVDFIVKKCFLYQLDLKKRGF